MKKLDNLSSAKPPEAKKPAPQQILKPPVGGSMNNQNAKHPLKEAPVTPYSKKPKQLLSPVNPL
jgi:hypothetical protein